MITEWNLNYMDRGCYCTMELSAKAEATTLLQSSLALSLICLVGRSFLVVGWRPEGEHR